MNPYNTSREATAYVLDRIFEQATSDGSIFTDFERRLLNGMETEEEIEAFEDQNEGDDAERLWRKVDVLVRHCLEREGQFGGREVQRRYEAALQLAATDSHYLAQILKGLVEAKLSTKLKRGLRRWAVLLPICFVGGIALAAAMFWIFPTIEGLKNTSPGRMLEEHGTLLFFAILLCIALAQRLVVEIALAAVGRKLTSNAPGYCCEICYQQLRCRSKPPVAILGKQLRRMNFCGRFALTKRHSCLNFRNSVGSSCPVNRRANNGVRRTSISALTTRGTLPGSLGRICLEIAFIVAVSQGGLFGAEPQNHEPNGTTVTTRPASRSVPCTSDSTESTTPQAVENGVKVSISPVRQRVAVGYSLQLAATVTGATNTDVLWSVHGEGCSDFDCGSIERNVYFAPAAVPNPPMVRLTATSKADPRASESVAVCLVRPDPQWRALSAAEAVHGSSIRASKASAGSPPTSDSVQILSDVQGVDFGPYLQRVVHNVKRNWYSAIPSTALPPLLKRGTVALEFAIAKNGSIEGLKYATSSGDVALDRACYFGISESSPFPPLPSEYKDQSLRLRMIFSYNPGSSVDSAKSP